MRFLVLLILTIASLNAQAKSVLRDYERVFWDCSKGSTAILGIRHFVLDEVPSVLLVNANTLETKISKLDSVTCRPATELSLNNTYFQTLRQYVNQNKDKTANAGLIKLNSTHNFLTIDMCPSSKNFESHFFDWIRQSKTDIGIAISGNWLLKHTQEFNEIKNLPVKITWINHTLTHPYKPGLALDQNFLLTPGVSLETEIIQNEKVMLENGLTPSVYVRFPGLVSSPEIVDKVLAWGLLPLGSDAWLAKGQNPKPGSIVLVHGNGNESQGIQVFFDKLKIMLQFGFKGLVFK